MKTVEDDEGNRYLLVKRSGESSLVRDPATGEERYLPNDRLTATGESPLEAATRAVPEPARRVLTAVRDDRALGLLVEIDRRGTVAVRTLMDAYDMCETDVHGALAELRAAGLVEATDIAGERGYRTTEIGTEGVAHLTGT